MKALVRTALVLCLVCEPAFADTLVMKSGENKKGKILEETEKSVLFNSQADGVVTEVPKSDISIVDHDPAPGEPQKSKFLSEFSTTVPKKRYQSLAIKKDEAPPDKDPLSFFAKPGNKQAPSDQSASFQAFTKMIIDWLSAHPETQKLLPEWLGKLKSKEGELDKLAKVAKEA